MSLQTIKSELENLSNTGNLRFSTIGQTVSSIGIITEQLPPFGDFLLTNNTITLSGTGSGETLTVQSAFDWNLLKGVKINITVTNDSSTTGRYITKLLFEAPDSAKLTIPGLSWFSLGKFSIMGQNLPFAQTQSELSEDAILEIYTTLVLQSDSSSTPLPIKIQSGYDGLTLSLNTEAITLPSINDILSAFGADKSGILLPDTLNSLTNFSLLDIFVTFQFGDPTTTVSQIGVEIGNSASASGGWAIIPDFFSLESYKIGVNVANPLNNTSRSVGGLIEAKAKLGKVDIDIAALHPASGGWLFQGFIGEETPVPLGDLLNGFASQFKVTLPDALHDFTLKDFEFAFDTITYDVSGQFTLDFTVNGTAVELTVSASLVHSGTVYHPTVTGKLTIGKSIFTVSFDDQVGSRKFTATWPGDKNNLLEFENIASTFGFTLPSIPDSLKLSLIGASLVYDFANSTLVLEASSLNFGNAVFVAYKNSTTLKWQFYFGLIVGKPINLSNLPLINKVLSDDEKIEIKDLQVLIASASLDPNKTADKAEITGINKLIDTGYPKIPEQGLPGTVAVSAKFDFGGFVFPLSIGTPGKGTSTTGLPVPAALAADSGTSIGNGTGNNTGAIPPPTQSADGATWFNIQKSFGPVNFQKIGVKYEDGVLWFLLNAALTAAGLEISVVGLAVGSPLKSFEPEFNIEGLGIEYSNQAVTISGAFIKMPVNAPITLEFGGTATIQLKTLGISAIGAYAQFSGQTSMFVFANVNGPFGGPAFFFITGFCGGFGYNSKLRIPGQNEVYQFPFVSSLSDPNVLGNNLSPTDVLQKVMGGTNPWVTPSVGDIWLSAGIKFTTFEVVNSTALLVAEFGSKFLLALIGLSRARFPMEGPLVYAYVELQLEVLFDPGDGVISMTAVLSPNSYILDKACHLTGGFAMVFWFGPSPYAGDFVITLGGYSPYFTPPDYYPQEPRLGFNWALDSTISITGGVYFALTPAAIMAGGSLNATYQSGNLKAWFTAYADIIIWYNPFHFLADIGLNVGASYKADLLFCSKTFTVELGADLTLWGPATGGTATIHWFVISFTVKFGADQSSGLDKQVWSDFIKVLPTPENVVKIVPLTGLLSGQAPATDSGLANVPGVLAPAVAPAEPATWIVRADNFQFTTNSSVPLSELYIEGNTTPVKKGSALNIKPMEATQLTSQKTLSIVSKETGQNVLDSSWNIEFITGDVPSALWGTGSNRKLPSGDYLISDQLAGFRIQVPSPVLGTGTGDISIQNDLQYDPLSPGVIPLQLGLNPQGPVPVISSETIAEIEQIMSTTVKGQRDNIFNTFSQLGLEGLTNGDLTHLADKAGALFSNEPLLINS